MTKAGPELLDHAFRLQQQGKLKEAERSYRRFLSLYPKHPGALHMCGVVAFQLKQYKAAKALIGEALSVFPADPQAHYNLAHVLAAMEDFSGAVQSYRAAISLNPAYPEAHFSLGRTLLAVKEPKAAAEAFQAATRYRRAGKDYRNLGLVLMDLTDYPGAEKAFRGAAEIEPGNGDAWLGLGNALFKQKQMDAALAAYEQALAVNPQSAAIHSTMGNLLRYMERPAEAEAACRQALALAPGFAPALGNLANVLFEDGRIEQALPAYERAVAAAPDEPLAHLQLALPLLLTGQFSRGWEEFEWRKQCPNWWGNPCTEKPWRGEPLRGKTIVLRVEQGLGDTIQFCRYALPLAGMGARVVLEVQPLLVPLLRSLPGVEVAAIGDALPPFDYQAPLMSLPRIMAGDEIFAPAAYLTAEPSRVEYWRNRLPGDGFKIGIAWQGNPNVEIDRGRSIPLAHFKALANVPGIRLFSLQKHDGLAQLDGFGAPLWQAPDSCDSDGAFLDTAAIMMNLDLVITSDTAMAHVAGALGCPVWVLLKAVPDWRWLLGRTDSPWYPATRLFRQERHGDWAPVMAEAIAALPVKP